MSGIISGAILAGGHATRLGGINKALIETRAGQSTLSHLMSQMRLAGIHDIMILANEPMPYAGLGLDVIPDIHRGMGPLGGVEASLSHAMRQGHDAVCFLPCDLPNISAREIRTLLGAYTAFQAAAVFAAVHAGHEKRGHFACSVMGRGALPEVMQALLGQRRSLENLLTKIKAQPVLFPNAAPFVNLNTPDDLRNWRERIKRAGQHREGRVGDVQTS